VQRAFWILATVYFATFLAWFHVQRLYGTGDNPEGRQRRYFVLGTALMPSQDSGIIDLGRRLANVEFMPQRIPLVGGAAAIWIVATLLGDSILRLTLGRTRLGGWTRFTYAFGVGMGALSLVTLGLGLFGQLTHRAAINIAIVSTVSWLVLVIAVRAPREPRTVDDRPSLGWKTKAALLLTMAFFAAASLLSACLPTTDYDALGYHLLAPREWWEAGRIFFLPHNVYASFPFLTEMFPLLGMTAIRDWYAGGIIGQVSLWAFAPMGGLAVGLLGARWFGRPAGWAAATIYFTAPWVFRLSTIPYVEGAMLFFGALAVLALAERRMFLAGAFVGCAASCKYTALVMLGLPLGAAVLRMVWSQRSLRSVVIFGLGVLLFFGPWLVRNAVWTGNPVYPLAYSIFGGTNWSPEKAAKFAAGHRSTDFSLGSVARYVVEIPVLSDWQSGLVFALAPIPIAVCLFRRRQGVEACTAVWMLSALVLWQFAAFYLFTHRLDRFWLPLLPYACVLAGAGWSAFPHAWRSWLVTPLCSVALLYNFAYSITPYCALNDRTADLFRAHREFSKGRASKAVLLADESGKIPFGARVLYVGFAGVYYSDHPYRYNSVFDDALLEILVADPKSPNGIAPLAELRRRFRERGIDYVVVDWEWIRKYRSPGNYGYTEFITPKLFDELMAMSFLWRNFSEALEVPDEKRSMEPKLEIYRVQFELQP
jgi:4-amino-4-deoxy-L-arabinose transferase-like glycosyltransferase